MPSEYRAASLNQPNAKFSEIDEVTTRSTGPGSKALPPDKAISKRRTIGQDAEQNKTKICVTHHPATVSAKQNQNISIRFNSGAGYSAGPLTCNPTLPKICDALHRTEIDPPEGSPTARYAGHARLQIVGVPLSLLANVYS